MTKQGGNPHSAGYGLGPVHHVGLVVTDLDAAAAELERVYGTPITVFPEHRYACRVDGIAQVTTQRLALSTAGPPYLELLRSVPNSSVWRPTAGIHHVGFVVPDVAVASARLARRGLPLWMAGGDADGSPVGACYHRDRLGQIVELLDRTVADRLAARAQGSAAPTP